MDAHFYNATSGFVRRSMSSDCVLDARLLCGLLLHQTACAVCICLCRCQNLYWGSMADNFKFVRVELPEGSFTFNTSQVTHSETFSPANRPTSTTVKASSDSGQSLAVTYTVIIPDLVFGSSPVEDIVEVRGGAVGDIG